MQRLLGSLGETKKYVTAFALAPVRVKLQWGERVTFIS